jgi:HlyD family secretion protein
MKFTKTRAITAVIIVVLVAWLIYYFASPKNATVNEVTAIRGNIVQQVSVTGNVKPAESVDLAFEKSGKVSWIYANVGDKISSGQLLVQLNTSELSAQLNKAEADLSSQKSELNKSQVVLANYYESTSDVLNDAYAKVNDAVRNQISALFVNADMTNPQLTYMANDSQAQIDVQSQRILIGSELNKWKSELNNPNLASSNVGLDQAIQSAQSRLKITIAFLNRLMDALANASLSGATLTSYKTSITTAISQTNTALANVNNQEQEISVQKATIASEESSIKSYEASTEDIKAQLNKASLYAPISGTVIKQDAKVGEIAAANTVLVSIITASKLEVEANVPEADIAKVKIGDPAQITLDAYGNDIIFDAKVVSIDPAETIIEGVATYKTKFQFTKEDSRPKPGMTANIDITTDRHENVVVIPQRAVTAKTNGKFVLVDTGNPQKPEEREVKTGLRGPDGNVEITDGLREGEKVIIPTLE